MEGKYAILTLAGTKAIFPQYKLSKKILSIFTKYYLLKKLPIQKEEVFYMQEPGYLVFLPFDKEEVKKNPTFIRQFVNNLVKKNEFGLVLVEKELRKYIDFPYVSCTWLFKIFMFPQIVERIVKSYKIDCKNMKWVLLDSNDSRMEYLLELMLPYLNHLTIVTARPLHFGAFVECAYHCNGLVVEILTTPLKEALIGAFIIAAGNQDMAGSHFYNKDYLYFEKNAFVLLLDMDQKRIQYMHYKRTDLTIIYDASIKILEDEIDMELATEILCMLNWNVKLFFEHKGKLRYNQEAQVLVKKYKMELKEIFVL